MTYEIRPGDVVQLKSGGPNMSVARIEHQGGVLTARCKWLDGNKKQTREFPVALLTHTN
jgi:uncharacterized protein YodC (DUF2158 family)